MKTHNPKKLKTTRPLFSCGFFRHCTQTVLSPTTTSNPPTLPLQPPRQPPHAESSSSSSSNTSQSFTQWRFPLPLPNSPISPYLQPEVSPSNPPPYATQKHDPQPPLVVIVNVQELFHVAEVQMSTGSDLDRLRAFDMLEKSLVPNPCAALECGDKVPCPSAVMKQVVGYLKEKAGSKSASKILFALCLVEINRHVAVEVGAVGRVVEALSELEGAAAERALAALDLLCTVAEGAAEVRAHALAVPMMVGVMGRMEGRGKEYALSVLAVIFGGSGDRVAVAPPEEVGRAVALAMQGNCSARGKRKGVQLLKALQERDWSVGFE